MTVNSGRSWSPSRPLDPECPGCGHDPHGPSGCNAIVHITKEKCRCPVDDRTCTVKGCKHRGTRHSPATNACLDCFDWYPNDDSAVQGGVYHAFKPE